MKRPERQGVMLFHPVEGSRISKLPPRVIHQPKLNGDRFWVNWFHGDPVLLSSYGNEWKFMDHIKEALIKLAKFHTGNLPFDGELYVHGWNQNRIHSVVSQKNTKHPDAEQIQAHIFDIKLEGMQQYRRLDILDNIPLSYLGDYLYKVPWDYMQPDDYVQQTAIYLSEGYEGIIIRDPLSLYQEKRLSNMLKYKPTETDEYEIIGFSEGVGRISGMLGAFLVKGDDGTPFSVGTGMTDEQRKRYWSIRTTLLGHFLITKHETIQTSGGIPLCCRVKGVN